jgi:hypothetical protein
VFNNLKGLLLELLTSVLCLSTSLSDSSEFRSASSVHGYQNLNVLSCPPWHEASKTSQPEIKQTPAECINITYIYNIYMEHTHRHPFNTENAGKTALSYINKWQQCLYLYNGVPELSLAPLYHLLDSTPNEI